MIYLLTIAVVFFFSIVLPKKSSKYKSETSVSEWIVTGVMAIFVCAIVGIVISSHNDTKATETFLGDSKARLVQDSYLQTVGDNQNKAVSSEYGEVMVRRVVMSDDVKEPTIKTYLYKTPRGDFNIWTFNIFLTKEYKKHDLVLPNVYE